MDADLQDDMDAVDAMVDNTVPAATLSMVSAPRAKRYRFQTRSHRVV
jgi:hypothetical protein